MAGGGSSVPGHPLAYDTTSTSLCLNSLIRAVTLHHFSIYNVVESLQCALCDQERLVHLAAFICSVQFHQRTKVSSALSFF